MWDAFLKTFPYRPPRWPLSVSNDLPPMHGGVFLFNCSSAYCSSASTLQDRIVLNPTGLDIPWISTGASDCIDSANGAEIIQLHLQHVHFTVNFLEGTGLRRNTNRVVLKTHIFDYVTRDADQRALLDNLTAFWVLPKA
ncbi:uncharacterized protein ARMOST_20276 [Armillaria ostoyae]|uniref:Uncharacterized protein n=1 Tax=Armillaria ostoyae TaxID=47428 RepID=A0A284S6V2_ARMOS|nr:uncharacterized protein ARMOST_20276 [Armillaria ostoyae]